MLRMQASLGVSLLWLAAVAGRAALAAGTEDGRPPLTALGLDFEEAILLSDDLCWDSSGAGDGGHCALHALQVRGQRLSSTGLAPRAGSRDGSQRSAAADIRPAASLARTPAAAAARPEIPAAPLAALEMLRSTSAAVFECAVAAARRPVASVVLLGLRAVSAARGEATATASSMMPVVLLLVMVVLIVGCVAANRSMRLLDKRAELHVPLPTAYRHSCSSRASVEEAFECREGARRSLLPWSRRSLQASTAEDLGTLSSCHSALPTQDTTVFPNSASATATGALVASSQDLVNVMWDYARSTNQEVDKTAAGAAAEGPAPRLPRPLGGGRRFRGEEPQREAPRPEEPAPHGPREQRASLRLEPQPRVSVEPRAWPPQEVARRGGTTGGERERRRQTAVAGFLQEHGFLGGISGGKRNLMNTTYPLHRAAKLGDAQMVEWLLVEGADPFQTNSAGRTPAQVAQRHDRTNSHRKVLQLLSAPDVALSGGA